ncbi:polygalacturonate 4-alpha-galacturonosyltransferase [Rhodamnia argentea]|uniref:Hexosyltransferase n=1 Tax=Rhodamnia argentea TaxID=178133 RepID=A0A8B8MP57_9MYRT|nr:polygalacturonate 4-alpha-galacturonosyltransferase [Rhodamnia argentea]XP_048131933.1 polygalacturonate 4-alpha-galacturonosyltransferase [Rhodamnia argentea]XP_048131934.1 polygalacturonate 4-alpha-galacturonosyltransferase [Rhodamnia argentea]XP_048131935.1 polygalacturonate 4-alpha-galacturonosyltransferase [Rhodamnia argentea]
MALKRGASGVGICRSRSGGSRLVLVVLAFFCVLSPLLFYFGKGLHAGSAHGDDDTSNGSGKENIDWRERMALQHLSSLFSKEVLDVITSNIDDSNPLSLDSFRKSNMSASWNIDGAQASFENKPKKSAADMKQQTPKGMVNDSSDEQSQFVDSPAKLARRQLREKRRLKRAAELVQQDEEVTVKLENAAIERSKSVDSAVLGKYSIWRKENENENTDSTIRFMRDQMIMARVYLTIAKMKNKLDLYQELQTRIKESQRALGEASGDADLHHSAPERMKAMGQVLSKAREQLYDCKLVTGKLRAMLQTADEQVRSLKRQSTFLSQLAAKTIPNAIHCLSMRLTIEYYLLSPKKRKFPRSENLENRDLYHYALFSDNVLAASVVVNSTVMNSKDPSKHVFHLVTDRLNYGAMNMWFLLNPPGKATIHVENVDEFKWLNSSYCPVLRQLESAAMKEYYFKADHPTTLSSGSSNLKYRNPKYLSMLNHLRFYLPQVYPKLDKILFLDDDIVVQKDLTGLWSVNLHGKVNGAVETCGESFHRFDKYLNFSNPHIARNFDPNACGWAYGMNMFDLKEWKRKDITGIYHKWQNMNEDRVLWKLGTLPPGLITFYGLTHPLDKSWHVLGLGYNPSIDRSEIDNAAVIHYNGNMKPWLELAMTKYRPYWTKYIKYDHPYLRTCNLSD